jgi:tetratricopeptide (TPR) repeat protein
MSNDDSAESSGLTPIKRKRLENCFQHATKIMQKGEYDFDYAHGLLAQCVAGDPSNQEYITPFLENLYKKYNNNRKGNKLGALTAVGTRGAMKKATAQKQWEAVVKSAVDLLKLNPWDTAALTCFAAACEGYGYDECELRWLRAALSSAPSDAEVNRLCAVALTKRAQYDQAIACWHRVKEARPNDEDVDREIATLALRKARAKETYDEPEKQAAQTTSNSAAAAGLETQQSTRLSPEDKLKRQIAKEPQQVTNYLDLAQIYVNSERYREAEAVLVKALEVSNNNPDVRERLQDAQQSNLQRRVQNAEEKARASRSEEDVKEYRRLRKKLRVLEAEVYKFRCERYPANLLYKYELGLRYQALAQPGEAIKQFQLAKSDPRRKGYCLLNLGQCFEQVKQARLALSHYQQAIEEIPDRDTDNKKVALYLAGRLALRVGDKDAARQYLSTLAQLDFGYKDVSALLDKIDQDDNDNASGEETAE